MKAYFIGKYKEPADCKVSFTASVLYYCLMAKETLKNAVYDLRTFKGATQEDLAHAVGVTRQTIIAIEKGNYAPSIILALKIAEYFRMPVEDIFKISK